MSEKKTIHFRYFRLISKHKRFDFLYKNVKYVMEFDSEDFKKECGLVLMINSGQSRNIDTSLLLWLSVYFGEDFLNPFQTQDRRFCKDRGAFEFNEKNFLTFISSVEKTPFKSYPKWKRELFDRAIIYYSIGVRSGVEYMPLTMGFFGMSLECIGNVRYGKRDKHYTLGDEHFIELLNTRLKKYKSNPKYKSDVKKFQKKILQDIKIVHKIRNAYYGHSLLHLKKDRNFLSKVLREWYVGCGYTKKFANKSFKVSRIDDDVAREAHGLYKVGLRTSRLFIFMLLGFSTSVPFATYDYKIVGDYGSKRN